MHAVVLDFGTLDLADVDVATLEAPLGTVTYRAQTAPGEIVAALAGADVAITNKVPIGADVMAKLTDVRLICIAATGTNNVDLAAAAEHGIAVTNVRNYCTASLVQHVFALILSLTLHLGEYRERIAAGAWAHSAHFNLLEYPVRELTGKVFGVVGYGTLGQAVARVADVFGMQVMVAERPGVTPREGRLSFDTVLAQADVLSLHCPLTESTRYLIGAAELDRMKPDALLINTARGAVVDTAALAAALDAGQIGGAGVDVLAQEPPATDEPLLEKDRHNLIVTPHIAWAAREARQRVLDELGANIDAFKRGQARNRVD